MNKILCLIMFTTLAACVSKPTKVTQEFVVPDWQKKQLALLKAPFVYNEKSVVFDARPFFLYKLSHMEGAHSFLASDFFKEIGDRKVQLDKRHFFHARRLSRYGISKDTPVVVQGRGLSGDGEEWLLALYLEFLGVKNIEPIIQTLPKSKQTTEIPILPKSQPTWKPRLSDSHIVTADELRRQGVSGKFDVVNTIVIDTRPPDDYLSGPLKLVGDYKTINIPWTDFIDKDSRPNIDIFDRLISVGVEPRKTVLCIGSKPGHSATACMVLRRMGFAESGVLLSQ